MADEIEKLEKLDLPEKPKRRRRRGIYLLPNLFTTAALFSGFYAIVAATNSRFEAAAIAVFVAMILDGLDGRVARLTNTQSAFGAEYDSLADVISFGLAPALVMYEWSLSSLGKAGWLAAFFYTAAAALRLARFNTQVGKVNKAYFQGLASPAAAAVMSGFVWLCTDYEINGRSQPIASVAWLITIATGFLMVSTLRYHSFKDLNLRGRVRFVTILIVVMIFVFISIDPPQVLFWGFSLYAVSGPVWTLIQKRKRRAARLATVDTQESTQPLQDDKDKQ